MNCPYCGAERQPGARHCPECGRPLLTSLSNRRYLLADASGREFPLRDGVSRIGRDPASNEIVLPDSSISSRHAAIEVSPTAVILRDLGSTNGTFHNGVQIHRPVQLGESSVVGFGDRELIFERQISEQSPIPRGIPVSTRPPRVEVIESTDQETLATAVAVIALILLAMLLHSVGLADRIQRDELTGGTPLALLGLVGLPVLAIVAIAAGRRWGYLLGMASALAGIIFVIVAGPMFSGDTVRRDLTTEYGSTGYWFLAISAIVAMVVEIIVLTLTLAGWRITRPGSGQLMSNRVQETTHQHPHHQ